MKHHAFFALVLAAALFLLLAACNLSSDDNAPDSPETLDPVVQVTFTTDTPDAPTAPPDVTATPLPTLPAAAPTARSAPTAINAPANIPTADLGQPAPLGAGPGAPPQINPPAAGQAVMGLRVGDDAVQGGGLALLDLPTDAFHQNPANPAQFVVVDAAGMVYITGQNAAGAYRLEQGPYTQFPAESRQANNAAAVLARWSPDGRYVAFIVSAGQQASDGVWVFEPGVYPPVQQVVDCPFDGARSCMIVTPPDDVRLWHSRELAWSPDGTSLLISADLPALGRRGLMRIAVTREERVRDQRPPLILYEYGTYAPDGTIIASGQNPDGAYVVDRLSASGSYLETLYSGPGGTWLGWAAQTASGAVVALARPGGPGGPVAVTAMDGTALTDPIGTAFPDRVAWAPDGSAVLVEAGGRVYLADLAGTVTDITAQLGGRPAGWLR